MANLAGRFGMLVVNNLDPAQAPLVVPAHFTLAGDDVLLKVARPTRYGPWVPTADLVGCVVTVTLTLPPAAPRPWP